MSIQSNPQSWKICKYDVFLSFRGEDIRNTFIDHLYNHLIREGIFAFKDDQKLEIGEPISPQLIRAIKNSRVCIVVFSKDYARSTWCLEEMTAIYQCIATGKIVLPVFYDVDPSHVRNQNGAYRHAFNLYTKKFKNETARVDGWKRAMTGLAHLAGFDVRNRSEYGEIQKIVQEVVKKLGHEGKKEHIGSLERTQDLLMTEVVDTSIRDYSGARNTDDLEVSVFNFGTKTMATNSFSEANKPLGQRLPRLKNIVQQAIKILSHKRKTEHRGKRKHSAEWLMDGLELLLFDFDTIVMATNNFSKANRLGQGGFGSVYKGRLTDGREIAVKRLSRNSAQGIKEFKNEVKLIFKLQHQNIVRLFGSSIQMDEKMLVYEYMENRSLDYFLFGKAKRSLLDWQRRFNIICGTAAGLLYLHQYSGFRIIHRDLKPSNVLLDVEMNPKISDFGMARIIGLDQIEEETYRIVGTYGYMSPEYAMHGIFSEKSDVFSFGVLLLEIISGVKNSRFRCTNNKFNLLGHAWMLWKEGNALDMVDSSVGDSYSLSEVLIRVIQVGLLCVQEHAEDRPTMASVVLMLSTSTASLPQPKSPAFFLHSETDPSSSKLDEYTYSCTASVNQVTVTMLDARY